jgi:tetratricopeptide (TPR) repeat protein
MAFQHFRRQDYASAERLARQVLQASPQHARAHELLAYVAGNRGDGQAALSHLEQACQQADCTPEALYYLGRCYLQAGQLTPAIDSFQRALHKGGEFFDALHDLAVAQASAGDFQGALAHYQRALSFRRDSPEIHFNLGCLHEELKAPDQALAHYDQALALQPRAAQVWSNRAAVLSDLGRYPQALASCDKSLELQPADARAWSNRGNALNNLGRYEESLASYDRALQLDPAYAPAWSNRADVLKALRRYEEVLTCCDRAIALAPGLPQAWSHRAAALTELGRHDEALTSADRAIACDPAYPPAWVRRADALGDLKRDEEALAAYQQALALDPGLAEAWSHQGTILHVSGRHEDALASFDQALALKPDYAACWSNRGNVLNDLGRPAEAEANFERAVQLDPGYAEARFNRALMYLQRQEFARGWDDFAWRWNVRAPVTKAMATSRPAWDGQTQAPRLLVWAEQGVGDEVLYASMFGELQARAPRAKVVADHRLVPILRRSFEQLEFIDRGTVVDEADYDFHLPMGDLGRVFRPSLAAFKGSRVPYLVDDAALTARLRKHLADRPGIQCGLSWKSANPKIGHHKTLALGQLAPLFDLPGVQFVNLQYGSVAEDIAALAPSHRERITLVEEVDTFHDLNSLLSLVQACDLVVTTSNSTAHLAGALGKTTLLLLPQAIGKLWYWSENAGDEGRHCLWYPSIEFYPQQAPGQWEAPINAIAHTLEGIARGKN